MVMRSDHDSFGRKIQPSDHIHEIYRLVDGQHSETPLAIVGTDHALAANRHTDLWEVQETVLEHAFKHAQPEWAPGDYRVITFANFSGGGLGAIDRPMPMPPGYARLSHSPHGELPARSFALTVLKRYPGTTLELVGNHIETFARHYHGEISSAELTELTGYALPSGVRPAHPNVEIAHGKE